MNCDGNYCHCRNRHYSVFPCCGTTSATYGERHLLCAAICVIAEGASSALNGGSFGEGFENGTLCYQNIYMHRMLMAIASLLESAEYKKVLFQMSKSTSTHTNLQQYTVKFTVSISPFRFNLLKRVPYSNYIHKDIVKSSMDFYCNSIQTDGEIIVYMSCPQSAYN